MKELYFVIEDQNGIQYYCDNNLNRISVVDHDNCFYHEYDSCYLITSEEKEVVKKDLGDKVVEQGNFEEADPVIGKYNIFAITGDSLERDIAENLGDFWDCTCEIDEAYEEYDQLYCDFDRSMNDKFGCSYFEDYLVRKALEETRVNQDFLVVFMSMYIKDYENWWRERYNSK